MRWISSSGGPLILLPRVAASLWRGVGDDSQLPSDYDAACAIEDFTGIVRKNGHDILVLDDEPMQTCFVEHEAAPLLVRWMYAPDEEAVLTSLGTLGLEANPEETVKCGFSSGDLLLLDAAYDGRDPIETLPVSIDPGEYNILTFIHKPSPEVALVIHRFVRCDVE